MRHIFWGIFVIGLVSISAFGQDAQSLGDLARANRERQQAEQASGVVPKVITNKDLPANQTAGIPAANATEPMTEVSGVQRTFRTNSESGQPSGARPYEGREFASAHNANLRGQIQEQENRIAQLEARIDRANATMHPNGGTVQYEGPMNRYQAMQGQHVEMMQQMLRQQKERLAALQDQERREGGHTTVYDP